MSRTTFWARGICLFTAIVVLTYGMSALAGKPAGKPGGGDQGPSYEIVPLDDAGGVFTDTAALDINDQGQIVGYVLDALAQGGAACWTTSEVDGQVQSELHLLPSLVGLSGEARSINESGEIVGRGEYGGQTVALYWQNHEAEPIILPPFAEDEGYGAFGINESGVICGRSQRGSESRAVAWRVSEIGIFGPIELPTPEFASAAAVNDNDADGRAEIVGAFRDAAFSVTAAVVWTVQSNGDGTLMIDPPRHELLDVLARANGINNLGEICGDDWTETTTSEAAVWASDSSQVLDRARDVHAAWAADINDSGVIVGTGDYWKKFTQAHRAVVWPGASRAMIMLNEFLDSDLPFTGLTGRAFGAKRTPLAVMGQWVPHGVDSPKPPDPPHPASPGVQPS
jgi:uncharacterized membrane protein